jgi:predicted nucleotidyltransferase
MRTYLDAGNVEHLNNEEADLVEKEDFDYVRAGARLLGRDIAVILRSETTKTVLEILNRETGEKDRYRLVEDMMDRSGVVNDNFDENLQLLEELRSGILERL